MRNTILILFVIVGSCLSSGCGSLAAHFRAPMSTRVSDPRYEMLTPIYGGVANDYSAMVDYLKSPIPGVEKEEYAEDWWSIFLLPLPIIDMPLSFVLDTIVLPSDILFWEKWAEEKKRKERVLKDS